MSAPETNVERQAKRHKGPLIGILIGLIAVVGFVYVVGGNDDLNDDAAARTAGEAVITD